MKTRPSLYDLNSEGYKSNDTRNREWNEIASILHQNGIIYLIFFNFVLNLLIF